MFSLSMLSFLALSVVLLLQSADAFTTSATFSHHNTQLYARRGRGSSFKEFGGEPSSSSNNDAKGIGKTSLSSSSPSQKSFNWCTVPSGYSLPTTPNKVALIDTKLPTLIDGATNPTGAVAVVKSENDQYYCFRSSCPSCQIPLTKAVLTTTGAQPKLECNFCKATYSLKNGERVESVNKPGIVGGLVNKVFSSKESGPLPIYQLGEKNGKLLIALD